MYLNRDLPSSTHLKLLHRIGDHSGGLRQSATDSGLRQLLCRGRNLGLGRDSGPRSGQLHSHSVIEVVQSVFDHFFIFRKWFILPHVALLVAGKLAVRVALHALQELTLQRGRSWGRRGRIGRCRRVPVTGHLLAVRRVERESGLAQGLTGQRGRVVRIATFLAPRALDRLGVDLRVVDGHDGVGRRLLC